MRTTPNSQLPTPKPSAAALISTAKRPGARHVIPSGHMSDAQPASQATAGATNDDESALVAALRAGDPKAFETMVRLYAGRMLAVARRLVGNDEEARDVVQDALLSAFRAISRFEGQSRVSTWLHRITVNTALMKLRTRRRKPEESIEPLLPSFQDDGHHAVRFSEWEGADRILERRDRARTPDLLLA